MGETSQDQKVNPRENRYLRIAIVLSVILGLNLAGTWLGHLVNFQLFPRHDTLLHAVLMVTVAIYIFFMATPFMPGIEVGLAVMLMLGYKSALLIYLCTLIALSMSYAIGRFFPLKLVHRFLKWLYLDKASELVSQLEPLNQQERLDLLNKRPPQNLPRFCLTTVILLSPWF